MKHLITFAALLGLGAFTIGCSQEAQVEQARDDFAEERRETGEAIGGAAADGVITTDEHRDIAEEKAEDVQQAGEVIKQEGQLQEERVDN